MAKKYPSKSSNEYGEKLAPASQAPHAAYKPANKSTDDTYDPQANEMKHDSVFAELVPTVVNSGNLAHKWGGGAQHVTLEEPPSGLAGD